MVNKSKIQNLISFIFLGVMSMCMFLIIPTENEKKVYKLFKGKEKR